MLQYISITIELIIAVLSLIMFFKKKIYGLGFFITFIIYVFYDFAKLTNLQVSIDFLNILFLIATLSALFSIINLYRKK